MEGWRCVWWREGSCYDRALLAARRTVAVLSGDPIHFPFAFSFCFASTHAGPVSFSFSSCASPYPLRFLSSGLRPSSSRSASWTTLFLVTPTPFSPWRHHDIWPRTRPGPYPFHDIIASSPLHDKTSALDPDHMYGHSLLAFPHCMMDIPLISDVRYNAMTHTDWYNTYLWRHRWLTLTYDDSFLGPPY